MRLALLECHGHRATGHYDRAAAEAVFRRLVESSGAEPEILTEASKVFRPGR